MAHPRVPTILRAAAGVGLLALALLGPPAAAQPALLYDAALGGTPDGPGQGMQYFATDSMFLIPPAAAAQSYVNGLTELRTDAALGDRAGYTADPGRVPALDRTAGFTLTVRLQLAAEQHTRVDRAGLSLLVLGADSRGIELGFWPDRVWAQSDNPLFTHAEELLVDTAQLTTYELALRGDSYTLRANGASLSGPLRDYRAAIPPVYRTPNLIFLGDNTTSGGSLSRIAYVAVEVAGPPPPATPTAEPAPTAGAGPGSSDLWLPLVVRP